MPAGVSSGFRRDLISSFGGSVVLTLVTCPTDAIRTRICNQPHDAQEQGVLYGSVRDALVKSSATEGVRELYKGLFPRSLRVCLHTRCSLSCSLADCSASCAAETGRARSAERTNAVRPGAEVRAPITKPPPRLFRELYIAYMYM
jgi:hypothetical protein